MKGCGLMWLGAAALLVACSSEEQAPRSAGEPCEAASECESTICYTSTCVDPEAETIERYAALYTFDYAARVRDGRAVVGHDGTVWLATYSRPDEDGPAEVHLAAFACQGGCGAEASGPVD